MNQQITTQIAKLLAEAGSAHHYFEQVVLKGVYDQDWPAWYADYILEHGLNTLLEQPVNKEGFSQFLFESNELRKQQTPEPDWVDYTAREIVARWG